MSDQPYDGFCQWCATEGVMAAEDTCQSCFEQGYRESAACEMCGSEKVTVTQHRSRATDDREVRGELQQVEIIECWEVRKCSECGHSRAISF